MESYQERCRSERCAEGVESSNRHSREGGRAFYRDDGDSSTTALRAFARNDRRSERQTHLAS